MAIKLKRIEDQVIVITGTCSGIGLATAELAARRKLLRWCWRLEANIPSKPLLPD